MQENDSKIENPDGSDDEAAMLAEFERLANEENSDTEDRVLEQGEIDNLFSDEGSSESGLMKILKSSKIYHERLPGLYAVFEKFIRSFGISLQQFTGTSVEVSLSEITSLPFEEYLDSIPMPSMINIFNIIEWEDSGLLVLDNPLFYRIIDILLGHRDHGIETITKKKLAEGRLYTLVEKSIIKQFVEVILKDLTISFSPFGYIKLRFERQENFPRFAAVAQPGNAAILVKIKINLNGKGGNLDFVVPYRAFDPVREKLSYTYSAGGNLGGDTFWEEHICRQINKVNVSLTAVLSEVKVSLADVLNWQVGSQIVLKAGPDPDVKIYCETENILVGKAGRVKGKLAVSIKGRAPKA